MFSRKNIALLLILCVAVLCLSGCTTKKSSGDADAVHATVMDVEKYGHAVLDITTADFTAAGYALGDIVHVHFESYESDMPFFDGYYSNPGKLLLRGTAPEEKVAVCINYGDFSKENDVSVGDTAEITMEKKAVMRSIQELYALKYSNNREDYSDGASFAKLIF